MGNSESSDKGKTNEEKDEEESSVSANLKAGAAVAGGALLAFGALKLASSLLTEDRPEETARRTPEGFHGGPSRTTTANKSVYGFGHTSQNASEKKIKIMTYNVWLHEDVAIDVRMQAICDLIEQHDPDVICFQEVTPNIYNIFRRCELWVDYRYCSLSPEQATGRSNFCMLLSKLPMKLLETVNEGGLVIASITISNSPKTLIVATAHLPKQTKPRENSKIVRRNQAKRAMDILNCRKNVVFGGDMNWVDDFDGPFPLQNNWVDAWLELKPEEDGSTYNTRSNEMLAGRRLLQERLDRFLCKPKDFRLVDVEIIGSDPIPGAAPYLDKSTWEYVPLYTSDHFGLVLTIELK
ncbi:hypothetical protein LUZ60_010785 [Juncus effusus]|nr:hypothetical protein LUZ60_010785 [Juncus effusus]